MPDYRRAWCPGGTWFFTINLQQRHGNGLLVRHIDTLRMAVRHARNKHPFNIHGWVVLPDNMHCMISLPENDSDFTLRWRLIKGDFPGASHPLSGVHHHDYGVVNEESGKDASGNI